MFTPSVIPPYRPSTRTAETGRALGVSKLSGLKKSLFDRVTLVTRYLQPRAINSRQWRLQQTSS